jgi:hypothetical protein
LRARIAFPLQHQHGEPGEAKLAGKEQPDRPGTGYDDVVFQENPFKARLDYNSVPSFDQVGDILRDCSLKKDKAAMHQLGTLSA